MSELLGFALFTPDLVVDVLRAAPGVDTGRLDVTEGVGRDPDISPGGRDTERPDARQRLVIRDHRAGGFDVAVAVAGPLAPDPGTVRVAAGQPRDPRPPGRE